MIEDSTMDNKLRQCSRGNIVQLKLFVLQRNTLVMTHICYIPVEVCLRQYILLTFGRRKGNVMMYKGNLIFVISLLLLMVPPASATTYYFANSGNDASNTCSAI